MRPIIKILVLLILICFGNFKNCTLTAQNIQPDTLIEKIEKLGNYLLFRNHDTNYIKNHGDRFALKIVAVSKSNYFSIRDRKQSTNLRYRPELGINFGLGFSYKWLALDITFNVGLREDKKFTDSKAFDFQCRIFSSKQYIEGTLQYYYGYQMDHTSGLNTDIQEISKIREDIRTIHLGLQYLYAYNYGRFSLKAPFVFNEIQRKSAGSMIIGASFSFFIMDADSSVVPPEVMDQFDKKLYLRDFNVLSLGLNLGYMYSLVYREHFFLSAGLIPAISYIAGDYLTISRNTLTSNISFKVKTIGAIGYNGRRIFTGFLFLRDTFSARIDKKLSMQIGHGKLSFFVGYRFGK